MKRIVVPVIAALALAACSQGDEPRAGQSVASEPVIEETVTPSAVEPEVSTQPPAPTPETTSRTPRPTASGPGDLSFCDYLQKTSDAAQQVEDPAQFVALVEGARAVAPGAISEDLDLYAQSVRKLATTVTGSPDEAAAADRWLTRNDAAVQQAEANVNSYSESACGRPFITGGG